MKKIRHISDAEKEIMNIIWQMDETFTAGELIERLSNKKEWKQTTIFTFLSRLVEKGMLSVTKGGKINVYQARISENEYKGLEAADYLKKMHGGSISDLVATLYKNNEISRGEIEELKKWFENK